jgi:tRNA (cmo5U34)-methyltransferase
MSGNFSFDKIKNFDSHIKTSIPRYSDVLEAIRGILQYYIKDYVKIYDIGCSTGKLLKKIDAEYRNKNISLVGYDSSDNLIPKSSGRCIFKKDDVLKGYINFEDADIIMAIFTMCFIIPKYRHGLIKKIYSGLNSGGIFIFTDKVYSENTRIQDIFTFLYYDFKRKVFKSEEILEKEKSLRGMQYPFTNNENIEMLREAGFKNIDVFWKNYNFQGYLCIK